MKSTLMLAAMVSLVTAPAWAIASRDCKLIEELNAFVASVTGWEVGTDCPELRRSYFAEPSEESHVSQVGGFDVSNGFITLSSELDLDDIFGQSVLLHELVHAAQKRAGLENEVVCRNALERDAYTVQSIFLRRHGLKDQAVTALLMSLFMGMCDEHIY